MRQRCDAAYYWSGRHTCKFACGSPPAGQASREWKVSTEGIAGEELVELDADHDQLRASLARFVDNAEGMSPPLGADLDWAVTRTC